MTLVEILIVVVIMAMIAAAVGPAVLAQWHEAQRIQAGTDAAAIGSIAEGYVLSGHDCPTAAELREARLLRAGTSELDPWGNAYVIECDEHQVVAWSPGPDGQPSTEDDVLPGRVSRD